MTARTAVLLPVYSSQSGLDRSLQSLQRAVGRFDVVIVDDGSPEPITAPLALRDDVRVFLLRLTRNQGIAAALNVGLRHILERGHEYIARLDAGDTVVPERFERQAEFLGCNPTCAVVSSFVDFVDASQSVLFRYRAPGEHARILRRMRLNSCLMHPASTIRASAFREAGLYREDAPGAEDYDLFLRMGQRYTLAVLPQMLTRLAYDPRGLSIAGRRQQQRTRLRLQLRYFDPRSPFSFLGVARTLVAMLVPQAAVAGFKRAGMN